MKVSKYLLDTWSYRKWKDRSIYGVISAVVASGKQVIVLIPEIALTYQTVNRFYSRFGDRISILNSRMSDGERYDQGLRAKNGEIDIMIICLPCLHHFKI